MDGADRMLPAALELGKAGVKIIPLEGKNPRINGNQWPDKATSDEHEIQSMWARHKNANIGVVLGERSRLICIDIDGKRGGLQWWEQNKDKFAPDVPIELTGRGDGSRHIYYRIPHDFGTVKSAHKFEDGVELLAEGCQVVVSPSIHPETKGAYTWDSFNTLANGLDLVPEIPDWLKEAIATKVRPPRGEIIEIKSACTDAARAKLLTDLETLDAACGRHQAIGRWITDAVSQGMPASEIDALATDWLLTHGRQPEDQPEEVSNWIRDAVKRLKDGRMKPSATYQALDMFEPEKEPEPVVPADMAWVKKLQRTPTGAVLSCRRNIELIFTEHPEIRGLFGWNELCADLAILRQPPWDRVRLVGPDGTVVQEVDYIQCASWLAHNFRLQASVQAVYEAMVSVGRQHPYHPIRQYLRSVTWDQRPRIARYFIDHVPCEGKENYLEAVAKVLFIGAVNRAFEPGCKLDYVVVLEGKQGVKKSTMFRHLFGARWFGDDVGEIGSADCVGVIRHQWCVEIAELDGMSRADITKIKSFITRQVDQVRLSYDRRSSYFPRQCIFVGTTNENKYLRDPVENRRFLPLTCKDLDQFHTIDLEQVIRDRDQLWAEAVARFDAGEKPYIKTADDMIEAILAQRERVEHDGWEEPIANYLSDKTFVQLAEVFEKGLGGDQAHLDRKHMMRITNVLRSLGWQDFTKEVKGVRKRGWRRDPSLDKAEVVKSSGVIKAEELL